MPYLPACPGNFLLTSVPHTFVPTTTNLVMRPTRSRKPDIENPKDLAAEFACAVTEHSTNEADWVARNGDESLFQTLQRMLPEVWAKAET